VVTGNDHRTGTGHMVQAADLRPMYHPQRWSHGELEDAIQHSENLPGVPSPPIRASRTRGAEI
jgi:hypothetical protein